ncbi:ShET2/EspL2 family type III secretion system effector toxin [Cupriavidus gilardii]|uniref:ShET2/EspL2 family type III secretion system effector toxin n=1 Tax=Cupriavidus gilardii TaxID=82541 RepID=A0A849B397_9BURK|nr:ShET2/EspL2 family type III secretion system effector toxin [Cupriavidus gilardii]MCT9016026.1 ShET2/EspL2 family type III secretion system effector toxin [Cupriavidus gilardii]MCT9055796.1 ShET2/EspL2 family type III secretion system effector toxin [Cupriavidus gilardii]NNH09632.1 ShET2/EspL2 family type III secretion system effector toxin [Cupriavidus gilardii]WNG69953.1 ShET2/EspL2 family type III secretion system effector toxin [Cupriavidus gilardii]
MLTAFPPAKSQPVVVRCAVPEALRVRDVRRLLLAQGGWLQCGSDRFRIRWENQQIVVRSATATKPQRQALAALLTERYHQRFEDRFHWKTGTDRRVRLNGRVAFARGRPCGPIACRHLAVFWLGLFLEDRPDGPDYSRLATPQALRDNVPVEYDYRVVPNPLQLGKLRVVMNGDWGKEFVARLADLERRGETATTLLVLTPDHAMAVGLRIVRQPHRTLHVVAFYDPNYTATHLEARFDDLEAVRALEARGFTEFAPDYPAFLLKTQPVSTVDAMLMIELDRATLRQLRDIDVTLPAQPRQLSGALPPLTADALWYLLRYGCDDAVRQLAPALRALPEQERIRRLGTNRSTQLFYDIMSLGLPSSARLFGELIADLPLEQRIHLLQSRADCGTTAFGYAVKAGRTEMFRPFLELLQALLPPDHHYAMLVAAMPDGTSALYHAFKHGRFDTPPAYAAALSSLPPMLLASLMCARSADNETGLEAAVRNDDLLTVGSVDKVLPLLPPQACVYLLKPAWRLIRRLNAQGRQQWLVEQRMRSHLERFAPSLLPGNGSGRGGRAKAPSKGWLRWDRKLG